MVKATLNRRDERLDSPVYIHQYVENEGISKPGNFWSGVNQSFRRLIFFHLSNKVNLGNRELASFYIKSIFVQ